jgi:hypothetical protein
MGRGRSSGCFGTRSKNSKDGEDAALLTDEEYARLVDARGRAQAEKLTLETELAAEVKAARLGANTSKEKDAAAESLRPLGDAKRATIESKVDEIMLPVEALRRRKETRERVEEDLRDREKLYREGLAQAAAGRAAAVGEKRAAERGSGDVGNPHGKSPSDHSPSGQSRGERRSQQRGGGDSRSDSGSRGGSERGDDDSDDVGGGSKGAGRDALALRKAKLSAKRAARGAWEREPGTTEYGRNGGGSMGRGGKKGKAARVAVEPWVSTGGKAAVERALPPEAERTKAAKIVREALTCPPEDMVLAMDVMREGAPRGGVPEAQAGMVPFSSLVMERTEYEASRVGGDGAQALLSVMGASGMIKASVMREEEPEGAAGGRVHAREQVQPCDPHARRGGGSAGAVGLQRGGGGVDHEVQQESDK